MIEIITLLLTIYISIILLRVLDSVHDKICNTLSRLDEIIFKRKKRE